MKPLIPYVGTNDYAKESFEFIGVKSNKPNKLKDLFAEACAVERCNFLDSIYENYEADVLTEEQALHLISLVEKADNLTDIAIDYIMFCEENDVSLDVDGINLYVFGESVMTRPAIIDSFHRDSIIADQRLKEHQFLESTDSTVALRCTEVYASTMENFHAYEAGESSTFDSYQNTQRLSDYPEFANLMIESIQAEMCKDIISPEDANIEKGFCLKAFEAFNVGEMHPETPLTGSDEQKSIRSTNIEDILKADNADIDSEQGLEGKAPALDLSTESAHDLAHVNLALSGFFTAFESAVPKNNVEFDTEIRKLFAKIKECCDVPAGENDDIFLKKCLNISKSRYAFKFKQNPPMQEQQIRSILLMLKFVPNKVNGKIVDYSKELNNIKLSLQFDSMDAGINVSYTYKEGKQPAPVAGAAPVKESAEDKYLFNRTKVANIINTVIESVTFDDSEFKHVTESTVEKYLTEELMNTDSLMHEYAEALLEYVHPTDESAVNDGYELLEKFKPAYEKVIGDRYACFVVLNESDMLKEFEEASEEDIDEDIKPIIELLNRLGYKTKYSCSGHDQTRITPDHKKDGVYQGKLYTTARITFDKKYNFKIIPKGWYQNPNSDKTSIYVEPLTYNPKNGSPDEAFKKWKEGYMNSLKAWVEDLEESKKTNSSDMVESFMECAYSMGGDILKGFKI